jgi:uncharacterized protein (TIGR00251 family)
MAWWSAKEGGIVVSVRVTPGARRSEVIDAAGDVLLVRVAAPAVEGMANAEVERLLGTSFGVRRSAISLVRGARSRDKSYVIAGIAEPPFEVFGAS